MIEKSSKLNIIFTLWFLIVAIIPSLFVALFAYSLQRQEVIQADQRELAIVTRLKVESFTGYVNGIMNSLHDLATATTVGLVSRDAIINSFEAYLSSGARQSEPAQYLVASDGTVLAPRGANPDIDPFIFQKIEDIKPFFILTYAQAYIAYPVVSGSLWLVTLVPAETISDMLHQNINDTKFFSETVLSGQEGDIGKTADLIVLDGQGLPVLDSLMQADLDATRPFDGRLREWIVTSRDASVEARASFAGRNVLINARRTTIAGTPLVFLATINMDEVTSLLYTNERTFIVFYIFALIFILVILYLFVRQVTRRIVKPINATVLDLIRSSEKIKASIEETRVGIGAQGKVADRLTNTYRDQVNDTKAVDAGIASIVSSLADISKQTRATARSAQLIDVLADTSQKEAQAARESMSSVKRLATAHEVLLETLRQYSTQVDTIAAQVRNISDATKYLSLNASIEASKSGRGTHSLASLVSEVGRLSLLSRDASVRINDLVRSIQSQVRESKQASAVELSEAEASLSVITKALESLGKMSQDATKISASVRVIDEEVRNQSASTSEIGLHSNDLTQKAKGTLREATKINTLVTRQRDSINTNSTVMNKMLVIITRLRGLVGISMKK